MTVPTAVQADPLAGLPPLISITRAGQILGLPRATAYRYAKAGHLPIRTVGPRLYVVTARLADLLTPDPAPPTDG
ncbi:helix-turn-helix domain-containing protein [Candidatus Frankia nodulisporulans]|uniref:helix-turn-helix domain-containing protein n=1 Tax=Candidatus Frankia nodulisporulans TaxID=2060052 RepID=UPI0013CFF542|nr:helix-turn-helix domain-containing protein [Candidatus Frankia nodulisporulans]